MLSFIWDAVIKEPIITTLMWLIKVTGSAGFAIILLTIIIQIIFIPLRTPSIESSFKMRKIKPDLDELKTKHKDDKMALAHAQMDLYKKHGINPWGGILPLLLSLPIIIALYQVISSALITGEGNIPTTFFWLDVTKADPYFLIPVIVAISQFFSMQLLTPPVPKDTNEKRVAEKNDKTSSPDDMAAMMQTQMKYMMPALSGFITATLPSGVGLYWITSVVFAIIQQKFVENRFEKKEIAKTYGS